MPTHPCEQGREPEHHSVFFRLRFCMDGSHQQAMGRLLVRYKLGCNLSYQIGSNTTFIFNIEAARIASQQITDETLTLTPEVERNAYTDMPSGNRYFGANVVPGEFAVEYNAVVELAA